MKIGVYLPHWSTACDGAPPSWADIVGAAQAAEEIGLDSVWVIGHHYLRFESGEPWALWDPWSVLAGVAATTSRVELGPLVSCTAYRNPALIAKAAATVDEISSGRLILGLGGGYFDAEFRALGVPTGDRVGRFAEAITIIHDLLQGATDDHKQNHYSVQDFAIGLPQTRPGGPPLLVGATKPRMMRLAARYADLWNAWLPFSIDPIGDLRAMQRQLDEACIDVSRDPNSLGRTTTVAVGLLGRTVRYGPHEMSPIGRSVGEIVDSLEQLRSEGVDHVQLCLAPATAEGIEALAPVLEQLAT